MGNFKSDRTDSRDSRERRGGFRDRSGGSRFGGRSEGRGGFRRDSRRFERRPLEMHDVTCDKCGKECQVPFKPSGDKPVLCSDCFRDSEGSGRGFGSRSREMPSSSGMSSEQLSEINAKLDKILRILEPKIATVVVSAEAPKVPEAKKTTRKSTSTKKKQ